VSIFGWRHLCYSFAGTQTTQGDFGMIISLEGIDSSGKETQAGLLSERMRRAGLKVGGTFHFPQYEKTKSGKVLRDLLDGKYSDFVAMHPNAVYPHFTLDRVESVPEVREALENGHVIFDRGTESNAAFQGAKLENDRETEQFARHLFDLEYGTLKIPRPDLILLLDIDPHAAAALRQDREQDQNEKDIEYQKRVCRVYRQMARYYGEAFRWRVIECMENGKLLSPDVVGGRVWDVVSEKFKDLEEDSHPRLP